jgi:hypothetical protein
LFERSGVSAFSFDLEAFRRTPLFFLPLQERMAQRDAGKHDEWRWYMTVLIVNLGIIKAVSTLTAIICPMITFNVDKLGDCFCHEAKWMPAIR